MNVSNATLSWLLFLVVGAGMGVVRYTNLTDPTYAAWLVQYGPYALIAIHIMLVIRAFGDTVYQGVLCVIIPFYSFYWLFFVSDAFYMRALVGGLLVGIGQDSVAFYQKHISDIVNKTDAWIQKGGS